MKRSAPHTRTDMPPPHRSQNRSKNKTKNYPFYEQKSIYAAKKRPKPKERRSQRRYKKLNQSQQEIDYLHKHLINLIMLHGKGRLIVGCVAWMTSPIIIEALSHAKAIWMCEANELCGSSWIQGSLWSLLARQDWDSIECSRNCLFSNKHYASKILNHL